MRPVWKEEPGRFLLMGIPGARIFTSDRTLGMAAGTPTASDLRDWAWRAGVMAQTLVGMQQVHGSCVESVYGGGDRVAPSCDGLVTDRPGVALAVRSADCLPVVLFDPFRDRLGAAHAGWKGIRAGILEELVQAVGSFQIWAAIGPGIGPCCYEVGAEFEEYFPSFLQHRQGKRFLDLPGVARDRLMRAGIREEALLSAPWCTACHPSCHSYRRDGAQAGRMVTAALLS